MKRKHFDGVNLQKTESNKTRLWVTLLLMTVFGIANASTANWYGYALYTSNGADWQDHFVSFNIQDPSAVQAVSETFPSVWAATYFDGFVWFVTTTRSLCKAPFDSETQTIGNYETVVAELEPYNLYVDMAYNPSDGMMYYLCHDSQYNAYLKRSNLDAPSEVEVVGSFGVKLWTLAINSQGRAYGVAYEGGNLYEINLDNATTTLVGPTGKDVWYTQSMAFDLDTDELYWAQFATINDHGLYQVNTETAYVTPLGDIGSGTQLAGLFMVPEPTPPEPEIIYEIHVEGFTPPVWGEHPNYDMHVPDDVPYALARASWHYVYGLSDPEVLPEEYFDDEEKAYYLSTTFSPRPGYQFDAHPTVYYNGNDSIFELGTLFGEEYVAFTIDFHVTNPMSVTDHQNSLSIWPVPVGDMLHLDVEAGETVSVFDVAGRMMMQEKYQGKLDVSQLTPGVYAIRAKGCTVKFVKE